MTPDSVVVPTRPGTPTPPPPPLPPHVQQTTERQWQLISSSGESHVPILERDHRWRLINGGSSQRLYLLLDNQIKLLPDHPQQGRWGTQLLLGHSRGDRIKPGSGDTLRYGDTVGLLVSTQMNNNNIEGLLTAASWAKDLPSIGSIRKNEKTFPLHLAVDLSSRYKGVWNSALDWKIKGGRDGDPLHTGEWFSLYNEWLVDYVVLSSGSTGSFGLQTISSGGGGTGESHKFTLALQPNIPWQGVICWHGRFPILGNAEPNSYLTGLCIPRLSLSAVTLIFWSHRSRWDVRVPQDTCMTTQQLTDVFGSAKPALPVEMWILVEAAPNFSVTTLPVNLTWGS